ncbi:MULTISPECIES: LemA family protein [Flavobacteriaceae]|jgi:LemA protein|uniref:LemA family protein n=1 Tax=Flagellimonas sp. MMG031 TaxID=3158549 RepID=A0AAU7MYP7_9FLAO|nr:MULTISPECIES: LemA family protein [unclassified Allomuricauda]MBO6531699.1 LemA family protein [Allomuricauda sp.]MBO6587523.1 LemA family protein [Allomuricauda sp.]MBO6617148.1 LemA family protein [Allomuricauda sp.]MBO6643841.1 LemA family protein [Allomuricauda sp.]MBO6745483.1 LemA family protein [Allomuricauda sp.]
MKKGIIAVIVLGLLGVIIVGWYVRTNNNLIDMKGQATKQWANVESSYQRRSDLIGNLVKTVQGAADFERETLSDVIEARSKATSTNIDANNLTQEQLAEFQQAQTGLSSALSRLLVTVERYPDLKASQNFLELQSQLEGTENRINVERNRFNDLAGEYNIRIQQIPTNIVASIANFESMPLFASDAGSEKAPDVNFEFN